MYIYIYTHIYIYILLYTISGHWETPVIPKFLSHECRMKMATFEARRPRGMAHQFIEGIKNSQGLYGILTNIIQEYSYIFSCDIFQMITQAITGIGHKHILHYIILYYIIVCFISLYHIILYNII